MISINAVGRVVADMEVRDSKNGSRYAKFSLAVPKGYGDKRKTIFFNVVAFDSVAKRLEAAKVKKGSQISVCGDFDVREFTRKDGSKGSSNELELYGWSYVDSPKADDKTAKNNDPERKMEYDEYYCSDEDDLP